MHIFFCFSILFYRLVTPETLSLEPHWRGPPANPGAFTQDLLTQMIINTIYKCKQMQKNGG